MTKNKDKAERKEKCITSKDLLKELEKMEFNVKEITFEDAVKFYNKRRKEEWKKTFALQTT